ncbi:MAG: hypothetical protein L3J49_05165 [Desulfobulbaceae bacterium]|nr:hypothetical protein [Desulfobulbaceae bacterium]
MLRGTTSHGEPAGYTILAPLILSQPAALLFSAAQAHAVQVHGGAEGLVSHQLGHLLFTLAMVVLLFRLGRSRLQGSGWHQFKGFLWLIIFWNVLTFTGHWMHHSVGSNHFIRVNNQITAFQINSGFDLIFYLTRLDHLLLVPAFILLLLAIRNWSLE